MCCTAETAADIDDNNVMQGGGSSVKGLCTLSLHSLTLFFAIETLTYIDNRQETMFVRV